MEEEAELQKMQGRIHDPCMMGVGSSLNWETLITPRAKEVAQQQRCQHKEMPMQDFPSRTYKEKHREDSLSPVNHPGPYQGEHSAS